MSFTALNYSKEGLEFDADEHTRELQVEQAFKLFQNALKLQKEANFEEANKEYKELFKINVVSDESPLLSPMIRTLRYLAYRNRGLLHIEEIKSKTLSQDSISEIIKELYELLLFSIDDLVTCLHYSDSDSSIVSLLLSIFKLFQNDRLSRYLIEYELTKEDDDIINQRNREQSHEYRVFANEEHKLLDKLGLERHTENLPELNETDLSFLKPIVDYSNTVMEDFNLEEKKTIKLDSTTWSSLISGLVDAIKTKAKNPKNRDTYSLLEEPITVLKVKVPEAIVEEPIIEEKEEELEEENHNAAKRPNQEPTDAPQRSSKRVRYQNDGDLSTFCVEEPKSRLIIDKLNLFLDKIGIQIQESEPSTYSNDFNDIYLNWTSRHNDILLHTSSDSDMEISQLFTSNILDDQKGPPLKDSDTSSIIDIINNTDTHFIDARNIVIKALLSPSKVGKILITDYQFDSRVFKSIELLVLSAEDILFNEQKLSNNENTELHVLYLGIFEILVNKFLRLKSQSKTNNGNKVITEVLDLTEILVLKWYKLNSQLNFVDTNLKLRFQWVSLFLLNYISKTGGLEERFTDLLQNVESNNSEIDIRFWNYEHIPALNVETIKSQRDRLNIISSLEKNLELVTGDSEETATLLEKLLLAKDISTLSPEEQLMINFINQNSISLRFRLWTFLLDHYITSNSLESYTNALKYTLPLLLKSLDDKYTEDAESDREQLLLTSLSYYNKFIDGYVKILKAANWKLSGTKEELSDLLKLFSTFFEIIHPFFALDSTNFKGYTQESFLKETIIYSMCVICVLFKELTNEPNESLELYLFFHDQLGAMKFCGFKGIFLDLSEFLLNGVSPNEITEAVLLQNLSCKFHMSLTSSNYIPIDHGTQKSEFNRMTAIHYSDYILESILSKGGNIQSSSKPDIKNSLDILFEAVGGPDANDPAVQFNTAQLNSFLNENLKLSSFHQALCGNFERSLRPIHGPESKTIKNGLYFLYGLINLNIYKARKKLAQSKVLDLEFIIKLFRYDIIYGTNRPDSWIYLGQAYSLQVEDDLTWTSDKLNSAEKKAVTADVQKKSIICSLISLSSIINNGIDDFTKFQLLSNLGFDLYHALSKPMCGAFMTTSSNTAFMKTNEIIKSDFKWTKDKLNFIYKFILKIFNFSISLKKDDWLLHLYKAKTLKKLGLTHPVVIRSILKSCELNSNGIEPNYILCSMIYKYFKSKILNEKEAIEYLKSTATFKDLELSESGPSEFYSYILSALKKLIMLDKKKWQHKPKARLSMIYYDLNQVEKAIEEIDSLVILKLTNKNLIHIWKPDLEAPGKHFIYVHQYVKFYVDLLNRVADINNLILFTKKLRRVGTSLVNLQEVWDYACTSVCVLVKEIVHTIPGYTDIEVPKLVYSEFMKSAERLNKLYQATDLIDESEIENFVLMLEIYEIRKMNNGFGATSLIDDTFNTLYLKLYLDKLSKGLINIENTTELQIQHADQHASASPVKLKVARRDILSAASLFSKIIEPKLKNYRITDEKKISVPQDVTDKHRTGASLLKNDNTASEPMTPKLDATIPEVEASKSEELVQTPELVKTPERKEERVEERVELNNESSTTVQVTPIVEEVSSAPEAQAISSTPKSGEVTDEEFHTPTQSVEES